MALSLTIAGCGTEPVQPGVLPRSLPAAPAAAEPESASPSEAQRFATWLAAFRREAQAAGIQEATLKAALDTAQLRHQSVQLDRAQPEFVRQVWDYLDSAVSATRVANGQARLAQHREAAQAASERFGVPAAVIVAIWGIESNYGQNYGDVPVIDALATLAFEGRREAWAKGELIAALRIIQQGDIDREHMIGSWAGAMGQTQFMPSAFLSRAVDADGDGRRDIWRSMPDVLASTANYLQRSGWRTGEAWAPELKLPEGFDPARADPGTRQDAEQWAAEGLRLADGSPLPRLSDASVLLPAGVRGPAFLVGPNFRAVLRYNNATSYALAVCLLAQRIDGGAPVQAAWPRDLRALTRSEVLSLQSALNRQGFAAGQPDGLVGPATRRALRDWQRSVGLPADGFPTTEVLARLLDQPTNGRQ
jgi:lytic murein transglycosylase